MNFHKKWLLDPFLTIDKLINSYSGCTVEGKEEKRGGGEEGKGEGEGF